MNRILARLKGGPLNDQIVSVADDLEKITGLKVNDVGLELYPTGEPKDWYEKDAGTLREMSEEEVILSDLNWADYGHERICEFHYGSDS